MSLQTAHPQRTSPANRALEERLEHFVQERTNGMVQHLSVRVHAGQVILSGTARTYYTKQLATHAVIDFVQGLCLTNNIRVA